VNRKLRDIVASKLVLIVRRMGREDAESSRGSLRKTHQH
jgi:hypothetical protein